MELERIRIKDVNGEIIFSVGESRLEVYENCAFVYWISNGTIVDPGPHKKVNVFPLNRISSMECYQKD